MVSVHKYNIAKGDQHNTRMSFQATNTICLITAYAPEKSLYSISCCKRSYKISRDEEYFPNMVAGLNKPVSLCCFRQWKILVHHWFHLPRHYCRPNVLLHFAHDQSFVFCTPVAQPSRCIVRNCNLCKTSRLPYETKHSLQAKVHAHGRNQVHS